jgi:hypothetical protein
MAQATRSDMIEVVVLEVKVELEENKKGKVPHKPLGHIEATLFVYLIELQSKYYLLLVGTRNYNKVQIMH